MDVEKKLHQGAKLVDMALTQAKVGVGDYHCAGGSLPLPGFVMAKD